MTIKGWTNELGAQKTTEDRPSPKKLQRRNKLTSSILMIIKVK